MTSEDLVLKISSCLANKRRLSKVSLVDIFNDVCSNGENCSLIVHTVFLRFLGCTGVHFQRSPLLCFCILTDNMSGWNTIDSDAVCFVFLSFKKLELTTGSVY